MKKEVIRKIAKEVVDEIAKLDRGQMPLPISARSVSLRNRRSGGRYGHQRG